MDFRDKKLKLIKRNIENLRNEMILAYVKNGADMRNAQVLEISQLLDEQLNRYEKCRTTARTASNGHTFVYRPRRATNLSVQV
ncbi:Spo0E family sporulation regulatory protein-aspartic acid phosphatase [Cohnella cellulosilytica]|uniref:Spo0E family sporulation regulatory protein-aspartic acid phosphatase n=1 Tax=Cohnella cellulosilytica TaxID=986710 RepID=A0ABW2FKN6_9BACL